MVGREQFEEKHDELDDKQGDVLILDPEKLKKHLPDLKFDKMLGREIARDIDEDDD